MSSYRVVDLSLTLDDGMRGVRLEPESSISTRGFNSQRLCLSSHAGTHLDAPIHWLTGALALDRVDLHKCLGPALLINLSHKSRESVITIGDLEPFADRIGPGSRILVRTGWDQHAGKPEYRSCFPRISLELAEWLASRGIWLLGLDTPSVTSLKEDDFQELQAVHQALLNAEIVIVESLANLADLSVQEVFFIALPLKIQGGDGSPVRAVAVEGLM